MARNCEGHGGNFLRSQGHKGRESGGRAGGTRGGRAEGERGESGGRVGGQGEGERGGWREELDRGAREQTTTPDVWKPRYSLLAAAFLCSVLKGDCICVETIHF